MENEEIKSEEEEQKVEETLDSLLEQAEKCENEGEKAVLLRKIGNSFANEEEWQAAKNYYAEAAEIFEKKEDYEELSKVMFNTGTVSVYARNYNEAVKEYEKAIDAAARAENYYTLGNTFYNMRQISNVFTGQDRALAYYEDKLHTAESKGQQALAGFLAHELGILYDKKSDDMPKKKEPGFFSKLFGGKEEEPQIDYTLKASEAYEKAVKLKTESGVDFETGDSMFQAGMAAEARGDAEKAYRFYIDALRQMNENENNRNFDMALNTLRLSVENIENQELKDEAEALVKETDEMFEEEEEGEESGEA